jgi:predicted glycoside hydrolase/deacetylase ChbG (UPF0249 family)
MARETAPLRLIVNADDLGCSAEVNDAIFGLMAKRRICSATLMANGPAVTEALSKVALFPGCSFGAHLNITEYRPLTGSPALRPLLDQDGTLRKIIRDGPITSALRQAVYEEWSAQLALLAAAGVPLSHVDSHNHSHVLPGLLPVMRQLRRRFQIPRTRVSINLFRPDERKPALLAVKKRLLNAALRSYCGFRTPDACADFVSFLAVPPAQYRSMSTIELMTHPGHPKYAEELRLLKSGEWIARLNGALTPYYEL